MICTATALKAVIELFVFFYILELKYALVTFYEVNHSGIPLSPLFEEKETQLEGFYVMPQLESIEMTETLSSGAEITKTPVKSLSELFKSDRKIAREIYLMADAGFGKTAFSKYLAVMWCHAHSPDGQSSKEDHLNALSEFEFLFLVSLRESSGVCNIDDMIKQQIVPHLSFSSPLSNKHLQEILHREKFLVILDGLDEWNHPKTDCTIFSKNIPHRIARKNCTVLTTTRPWKLSVINLKTSQIDRKIELVKLNEDTARQLQFNVLQKIHANFDDEELKRKTNDFNEEIRDYDLDDLKCVPLLLMYLIILWCDKIPLGQSKCGLYTSIIELLLSRTVKKYPDLHPTCEPSQRDIPQCFSEHEHFERYFPFLTVLGRLAFHTLFSKTRENMLVFDSSIAKTFLNESELKLSLQSGILTQSKVQVKSTKQSSKISFSHRSVQEYLSALYMSYPSESDVQKIILQNCKSLQNIVDMSAVFVYISGMNAKLISSISPELMSVIDKDKITNTYRCMAGYGYSSPLKYIQNMYISCIKENLDNNDLKLCLQDFFIDETCQQENYRTTLERLAKQNKNNIKSVSIENEDLGSLREIIDSFELTDLNNLQRIFCRGECEEADIIRLLFRTVKHAGVAPSISCSMTSALCERIQSLPQLEGICMEGFEISHAVLEEFLNYLTNRKSMKEIRLYSLNYTDHGISCDGAKLDLSQHTELRTLGLSEIPLSQLNMNVASLEECVVGYLYKPDLVSSYLSQLPAASKLNILKCVSLQSAGDIKTLLQILPLLVHVKKVTLWNINLGEMSPQMVNIERVVLMSVTISSSSFRNLVKQTEQLPHSVKVEIHGCTITPEPECEAVKQYVRTSESFVVTRDKKYLFVFVKSAVTTTTAD